MVTRVGLVMAGGTGTRLYPASREDRPKQFQAFGSDRSLLRQAADRLDFLDARYVITREAYEDRVAEIVPETMVITEPEPMDTGPALVYATHEIADREADPVLLCTPSDHIIGEGFRSDAERALDVAEETGGLVTLGVEPTRTATEYGYIVPDIRNQDKAPAGRTAGNTPDGPIQDYSPVDTFREKPDAETATELRDRGALWNAGMFAWRPEAFLAAARDSPLDGLVEALAAGDAPGGFERVDPISVDDAILEQAENVFVVPATFPWDDLGSWDAIERLLDGENATLGETLAIDATGNVLASDDKHVSVLGVDDIVVAAYDDRVLVVPKDRAQEVRSIVAALRETDDY